MAPYSLGVSTYTPHQIDVVYRVMALGAVTTRRLVAEYGPRVNWQRLVEGGYLREYHTVYGSVIGLGPTTYGARAENPDVAELQEAAYLTGPTTVADRAYQQDALSLMREQGYHLVGAEHKRTGKYVGSKTAAQWTRLRLRVPDLEMEGLEDHWGRVRLPAQWTPTQHALGHPYLYASVASGGIKLPRVRALLRQHRMDIHTWRSPLIVVVPDEGDLRAYVRGREARRRREHAEHRRLALHVGDPPYYPEITLVVLPRPGRSSVR